MYEREIERERERERERGKREGGRERESKRAFCGGTGGAFNAVDWRAM